MVENALYKDDRILQAAAVGIPDARLGELVAAIVHSSLHFETGYLRSLCLRRSHPSGYRLLRYHRADVAFSRLPRFAVPSLVIVRDEPLGKCLNISTQSAC
jgi:acyl-CoA synthetase (AMP-forming)/AMP-acid ligase II